MSIHIIAVGHKQPNWVYESVQMYSKRTHKPYDIQLTEIASPKTIDKQSASMRRKKEGEKILEKLPQNVVPVALCVEAMALDSMAFAQKIAQLLEQKNDPCFIIGGADGLSEEVLNHCSQKLSLSALTLPHGLARLLLVEQLYRASCIHANHPYHH